MTTPTIEDIIAEIRKLAADSPETIYNNGFGCYYQSGECSNGSVGCIVGQAARKFGVTDEYEGSAAKSFLAMSLGLSAKRDCNKFNWVRHVQNCQDKGISWGQAIENADTRDLIQV